jgi:hypothetical protein
MTAPLWRFALHIMLLAFAVQRGAAAVMLHLGGAPAALVASAAIAVLAAVVASIAVLMGRMVSGALIALAVVLALGAVVQFALLGPALGFPAVIQSIFGVTAVLVLRYFVVRAQQDPN